MKVTVWGMYHRVGVLSSRLPVSLRRVVSIIVRFGRG